MTEPNQPPILQTTKLTVPGSVPPLGGEPEVIPTTKVGGDGNLFEGAYGFQFFSMDNLPGGKAGEDMAVEAIKMLAHLLDSRFKIPYVPFRFGIESIVGVIPVAGDLIGLALGSFIISTAAQRGVPRPVLTRMMLNSGVDAVGGAIPILGDLFDVGWKANSKNAKLLEQALKEPDLTARSSRWVIAGLLLTLFAFFAGAAACGVLLIRWLFG